jgi:septal ring factor EnvC (AmiA/AmiB activator)
MKSLCWVVSGILLVALIVVGVLFGQSSGKLSQANTKTTDLENNLSSLQGNVSSLQSQLTTAQANSASLQTQLNTAQASVTKLTADLNTAQSSSTTALSQVKTLQSNLDSANASVTKLTGDLAAANTRATTFQTSLDKANADLAKATQDLAKATTDLTKANSDIKALRSPRHFSSVDELKTWLTKAGNVSGYTTSTAIDQAYILQVMALRDGFLLSPRITWDSNNNPTIECIAIAGGTVYLINIWDLSISAQTVKFARTPVATPLP